MTLTTYAEVPWNAPYHQRFEFHVVSDGDLGDDLRSIRDQEARRGLDKWPRLAMRRDVGLETEVVVNSTDHHEGAARPGWGPR